jgi:hypothetical protein
MIDHDKNAQLEAALRCTLSPQTFAFFQQYRSDIQNLTTGRGITLLDALERLPGEFLALEQWKASA